MVSKLHCEIEMEDEDEVVAVKIVVIVVGEASLRPNADAQVSLGLA